MIKTGRNKRCVWTIGTSNFAENHFAVYLPKLIETPILAGCPESGIVLDPFIGSGTTAIVAEKLKRNHIGIELSPEYIKIAKNRIKNLYSPDKDIANQNNLQGYYIVEKNDFVYNPRISIFAPVGPIKRNNLDKGLMSPLYSVFRFKKVNLDFIEHFFETRLWHDYLKSIANYGARHDRMNITVENFFDMPILLPLEPEQKKIADFLSAIDDKINLVNQQLEKTRNFKKGLLQQMFI